MGVQIEYRSRTIEKDFLIRIPDVTEADFDAISTDHSPYELFDYNLIVHSPASFEHELVGAFLHQIVGPFVAERELGWVPGPHYTLRLQPGRKVEPDLMFLAARRRPIISERHVDGTADLVVEIVSRSSRNYDLGEKRKAYRQAGTNEMWIVDTSRKQLLVDARHGRGYRSRVLGTGRLVSRAIPGFWLSVEWLWRRPLPKPLACLREILEEL